MFPAPVPTTILSVTLSNTILPALNTGTTERVLIGRLRLILSSISILSLFITTKSEEPGAKILPLVIDKSLLVNEIRLLM